MLTAPKYARPALFVLLTSAAFDSSQPEPNAQPVHALLQAADGASELPGGYGVALLQTLLSLGAVCLLAWVALRWASKRGFGFGARGQRVKVLERVTLDPRRSLYLVEVAGKVLLLGAGDGSSPTLLAELDPDALPEDRGSEALLRRRFCPPGQRRRLSTPCPP